MSALALANIFMPFAGLVLNHLVNIPLSLILGLGKYMAFFVALIIDVVQIYIYHNIINHTAVGQKYGWKIDAKKLAKFRIPRFLSRFHRSWIYIGVLILSAMPVYFGGVLSAVIAANMMKLNQRKSCIVIGVGSFAGCFIWTMGVWTVISFVIVQVKRFF